MKLDQVFKYRKSASNIPNRKELRNEIEDFHAEYCAVLDSNLVEEWPNFFVEDCIYRITARENAELGLPVGLMFAEGRAMLIDRAVATARTQMFAPRYMLHMIGNTRVVSVADDGLISAEASFLLLQTLVEGATSIHMAGRYHDVFTREGAILLLKERQVVYDTTVIANDLVYPV